MYTATPIVYADSFECLSWSEVVYVVWIKSYDNFITISTGSTLSFFRCYYYQSELIVDTLFAQRLLPFYVDFLTLHVFGPRWVYFAPVFSCMYC